MFKYNIHKQRGRKIFHWDNKKQTIRNKRYWTNKKSMQTQHVLMIVNVNGHNGQEMAD